MCSGVLVCSGISMNRVYLSILPYALADILDRCAQRLLVSDNFKNETVDKNEKSDSEG